MKYLRIFFTYKSIKIFSVTFKFYDGLYRAEIYKVTDITSSTTVSTNANHTVTAHWS